MATLPITAVVVVVVVVTYHNANNGIIYFLSSGMYVYIIWLLFGCCLVFKHCKLMLPQGIYSLGCWTFCVPKIFPSEKVVTELADQIKL